METSILPFEQEVKRMVNTVQKLREGRRTTIFDGSTNTFYRFRINPSEKRIFWIREASLDQRNWVTQNVYLRLRDVLKLVYDNKVKNNIND